MWIDMLPLILAVLGVIAGIGTRHLPASGVVALSLQAIPPIGYYCLTVFC
jgi:hypothetical protein